MVEGARSNEVLSFKVSGDGFRCRPIVAADFHPLAALARPKGSGLIAVVLQRECGFIPLSAVSLHDAGVPAAHMPAAPARSGACTQPLC